MTGAPDGASPHTSLAQPTPSNRSSRQDLNRTLRAAIDRALTDSSLTKTDLRVLLAVFNFTVGWAKTSDRLFLGQIADDVFQIGTKSSTRVQRDKVGRSLRRLEAAGVVWRDAPRRGRPQSADAPRYGVGLLVEMQPRPAAIPPENAARGGRNTGPEMQPQEGDTMQPREGDRPLGTPHTVEQVSPAAHAFGTHTADHHRDLNQNGDTEGLAFSRSSTIEPEPGPFDDKPAPIPAEAQARIDRALAGIRKAS